MGKNKKLAGFLAGELMIFGISGIVATIGFRDLSISRAAIFLGANLFFHLAVAQIELKTWKRRIRYPEAEGEL